MTVKTPDWGEMVTYFDGDGDPERAIVVDPVPDAEFVTLVTGDGATFGKSYVSKVETHTSIYPHADLGDEFTATTYAFKPGWDSADEPPDKDADEDDSEE